MRTVAVALALVSVFALVPAAEGADQCYTDLAAGQACITLPMTQPTLPPPAPGLPPQTSPYFGTYYLWFGPGECIPNPISDDCRGVEASKDSGIPVPEAGDPVPYVAPVCACVFGTVYKESNGVDGLQRHPVIFGQFRDADHMILL